MELSAPTLRRPARLLHGNVHPHTAGSRRSPPEGTVSALRQKIEQEIRERGPIPFSRYMELCLYDPELRYYSRNAAQFGKAGDFYTSSDVHAVFGRLLARQFDEMWRVLGSPEPHHVERTRSRPRIVRTGCAGLVREEVPRLFFVARCTCALGRTFRRLLRQRIETILSRIFNWKGLARTRVKMR